MSTAWELQRHAALDIVRLLMNAANRSVTTDISSQLSLEYCAPQCSAFANSSARVYDARAQEFRSAPISLLFSNTSIGSAFAFLPLLKGDSDFTSRWFSHGVKTLSGTSAALLFAAVWVIDSSVPVVALSLTLVNMMVDCSHKETAKR